jgi:hypothetical protein
MLILAVVGRVDMDVGSVLWSCDERVSRDIDDLEHLYPYYPYIYTSWRGSMTHHTRAASSTSVSVSHFPSIGQCPSPPFPPFDLHILVRPSSTSLPPPYEKCFVISSADTSEDQPHVRASVVRTLLPSHRPVLETDSSNGRTLNERNTRDGHVGDLATI